ncbi:MAG TPA: hypothetical protein DEF00_01130 [Candidatus Taylorbacteria bacterium]|nr:MAG: hypothetical protein UY03_C0007G0004 [Parcubacteria group bacterium GW2011_GWA2_47_64]KKU96381.1 MAG: hypothetical protein UY29_C0013G0033 [Parcubacteria group bacterium GW2011_GWC2_48_17]HBV00982.1 hypothetical protein [Candidatus Taylorbacteria bacterium]
MDTPHPAHTPETSGEPPEVKDIDEMLNERGFAAFLENYDDAESFEVTEENKEEIAARFRAFEASTTVVKQFEKVMDEKLQTEGKGRMKPEERKAYKEHVAELAAKNPDELLRLQSDLRALEEAPEKIREREAELARLKESWSTDKVKAGIAELAAKKADIEKSLKEADATKFSRMQRAFFTNFGARFSMGKIAGHLDKKIELTVELQEVDSTIKAAEEALSSSPEIMAGTKRALNEATAGLESAQESVFASNKVAQMVRERLISEAHKRCEASLESTDIGVLQKAAEQFRRDTELANKPGSDYLGFTPDDATSYEELLTDKIKEAVAQGIMGALESLPSGATQSRLERALRKFTELAEKEVGFFDKDTSKEFVLETLRAAEQDARTKSKGSGKSIMLKHLISKLSKAGVGVA